MSDGQIKPFLHFPIGQVGYFVTATTAQLFYQNVGRALPVNKEDEYRYRMVRPVVRE
jgi:hypothetical protein